MMRRTRLGALAGVILVGLAAGGAQAAPALADGVPAGGAQAGAANVVQVIEAQDKIIKADPALAALANFEKVKTAAAARKLIPQIRSFVVKVEHAATVVSQASATSAQKLGQTDWVAGARDEATGERDFALGLTESLKGEQTAALATFAKVKAPVAAGDVLAQRARKLLKIPAGQ